MKLPKDSVMVGQTLMTRQAWIEGIAKDWEIDAESIERKKQLASAAHRIQRAWKIHKAVGIQQAWKIHKAVRK